MSEMFDLVAFGEGILAGFRETDPIECPYDTDIAQKSFWLGVRSAQFEGSDEEFWAQEDRLGHSIGKIQ